MKVWFDLDGVLASFTQNIIPIVNEIWPGKLSPDFEPQDYGYTGIFSAEDWGLVWNEIKTRPDFWFQSPTIAANVSALRTWTRRQEHEIFYITSRINTGVANASSQTQAWLGIHKLWTPDSRLIVVKGAAAKKAVIEEHKIDFGIDDLPSTVVAANMLPWHRCYLLDQPWNSQTNCTRVKTLQEFLDIVDSCTDQRTSP